MRVFSYILCRHKMQVWGFKGLKGIDGVGGFMEFRVLGCMGCIDPIGLEGGCVTL